MAQLPQAANTADNHDVGGFRDVPAGTYEVALRKAEWRDTKSGTGKYIYMEFVILDGDYKGSILFERLNLVNDNATAVRIAQQKMNQLCNACLLSDVDDTDELLNIPVEATVVVEENPNSDFPPQAVIKKFANIDGEELKSPWD